MNNSIYPCLTIRNRMQEAADFYLSTFGEGAIAQTSPWAVQLELSGQKFLILNDGPTSLPNPSVSFMVILENQEETERCWHKLIEGGSSLMPLGSYDWSEKYGWLQDKYGVSWQLYTGSSSDAVQKFSPTFMFSGDVAGKAAEAVDFYTGLFPNSKVVGLLNYTKADGENPAFVKHGQFELNGYTMMAMDSSMSHGFSFNDAVSMVIECASQSEIDQYWESLSANGGKEVACGWLTDKYGISWQVVPKVLGKLLSDPQRAQRIMEPLLKMKKLVIADLENA
ncbi:VOC family protein [Pedobacter sp. SYSU D00535]|uniref:VOC family protein n=1 Tax=Pedobacter sp. SYSU D00535 TaxID=2810308 RepID=UPI001A9780F3|nr:VOC family protein [Pedobacter sp. SYSU D00535]